MGAARGLPVQGVMTSPAPILPTAPVAKGGPPPVATGGHFAGVLANLLPSGGAGQAATADRTNTPRSPAGPSGDPAKAPPMAGLEPADTPDAENQDVGAPPAQGAAAPVATPPGPATASAVPMPGPGQAAASSPKPLGKAGPKHPGGSGSPTPNGSEIASAGLGAPAAAGPPVTALVPAPSPAAFAAPAPDGGGQHEAAAGPGVRPAMMEAGLLAATGAAVAAAETVPRLPDAAHSPGAQASPALEAPQQAEAPAQPPLAGAVAPPAQAGPVAAADSPAPSGPARQLAPAFVELAQRPSGSTVMLRLDPAGLGHVQIRIERDAGGAATVQVTAEHPDTLRLLVADQPHLHRALDSAGVPPEGRTLGFSLDTPPQALPPAAPPGGGAGFGASGDGGRPGNGGFYRQGRPGGRHAGPDDGSAFTNPSAWLRAGVDITA